MPLARYFLYVGGILLALLVIAHVCLPALPLSEAAGVPSPVIKIYSDQRWPERIVLDTSASVIAPVQTSQPATETHATQVLDSPVRARDALAYLQPAVAGQPDASDSRKHDPKKQHPRKTSRRRAPGAFQVARHPPFGAFGFFGW
jgi:hypothetical protein